jgi:hypothetical protein
VHEAHSIREFEGITRKVAGRIRKVWTVWWGLIFAMMMAVVSEYGLSLQSSESKPVNHMMAKQATIGAGGKFVPQLRYSESRRIDHTVAKQSAIGAGGKFVQISHR